MIERVTNTELSARQLHAHDVHTKGYRIVRANLFFYYSFHRLVFQKLQHAQLENASLQKQLSSNGNARVKALEEALEEALNQRDGVIQKLRQVKKEKGENSRYSQAV